MKKIFLFFSVLLLMSACSTVGEYKINQVKLIPTPEAETHLNLEFKNEDIEIIGRIDEEIEFKYVYESDENNIDDTFSKYAYMGMIILFILNH